jgi:competence protein ComEC
LGVVLVTALFALGAPLLGLLLCACLPLVVGIRRAAWVCVLIAVVAAMLGLRSMASVTTLDPLRVLRGQILMPLVRVLPGDVGALAAGVTLGDTRYFSTALRSEMRLSATSHLVALSGFNVALILGWVRRLLRKRIRMRQEIIIGLLVLGSFVALAGAQPSLVRAALMGSVFLCAEYYGRRVSSLRVLVLTAAVMLLVAPSWITQLGFQLSFISSWALLATVGDMERLLMTTRVTMQHVRTYVIASFVAQLGVAPALCAAVGSISLIGFVVNPLVLPLITPVTAFAGATLLLAHVAPGLAYVLQPLVSLVSMPVLSLIALAAHVPLTVHSALPVTIGCALYLAWFVIRLVTRPTLW